MARGAQLSAEMAQGRGWGGRLKREGTYVYIQQIYVVVQQKLTQHCKAIILQLKKKSLTGMTHRQKSLGPAIFSFPVFSSFPSIPRGLIRVRSSSFPGGSCSFYSSLSGPLHRGGPFCLTPQSPILLPVSLWSWPQVTGFPSWQRWGSGPRPGKLPCLGDHCPKTDPAHHSPVLC